MLFADVDFDQSLQNALDDVTEFVPKFIAAVLILLIGFFVARAVQGVAVRLLERARFDSLVDRSGLGGHIESAGYPDSGVLLAKFLYYAVILMALQLAINVFGDSALQEAIDGLISLLPKIAIAAVIVIITGAIANAVRTLLGPALQTVGPRELVTNIAIAAIWVVGVFAALDQVGVAANITQTLFSAIVGSISLILVIKFGVGGIWAARDHFWPAVYDKFGATDDSAGRGPDSGTASGSPQPPSGQA